MCVLYVRLLSAHRIIIRGHIITLPALGACGFHSRAASPSIAVPALGQISRPFSAGGSVADADLGRKRKENEEEEEDEGRGRGKYQLTWDGANDLFQAVSCSILRASLRTQRRGSTTTGVAASTVQLKLNSTHQTGARGGPLH
jgi:hypothetical protein